MVLILKQSHKEWIIQIFSILLLIALNLMWILGINGEIRATAVAFDIAYIALALNKLRIVRKNGDSNE